MLTTEFISGLHITPEVKTAIIQYRNMFSSILLAFSGEHPIPANYLSFDYRANDKCPELVNSLMTAQEQASQPVFIEIGPAETINPWLICRHQAINHPGMKPLVLALDDHYPAAKSVGIYWPELTKADHSLSGIATNFSYNWYDLLKNRPNAAFQGIYINAPKPQEALVLGESALEHLGPQGKLAMVFEAICDERNNLRFSFLHENPADNRVDNIHCQGLAIDGIIAKAIKMGFIVQDLRPTIKEFRTFNYSLKNAAIKTELGRIDTPYIQPRDPNTAELDDLEFQTLIISANR